jgi:dTDP-4-dehydrorhamnose 3,5-epimerase
VKITDTALKGVHIIDNFAAHDERGTFVKTFNKRDFENSYLDFNIRESYFSVSHKNVLRGMHFQLPPSDHEKLVYVASGSIIDVVVDLRKNSSTYANYIAIELSALNKKSIFIPKGLAHGFISTKDDTITVYNVATEYNVNADCGIKFDSFGFDWGVDNPIMSKRDLQFESINKFKSPF